MNPFLSLDKDCAAVTLNLQNRVITPSRLFLGLTSLFRGTFFPGYILSRRQHFLNFTLDPQGHNSFLPIRLPSFLKGTSFILEAMSSTTFWTNLASLVSCSVFSTLMNSPSWMVHQTGSSTSLFNLIPFSYASKTLAPHWILEKIVLRHQGSQP